MSTLTLTGADDTVSVYQDLLGNVNAGASQNFTNVLVDGAIGVDTMSLDAGSKTDYFTLSTTGDGVITLTTASGSMSFKNFEKLQLWDITINLGTAANDTITGSVNNDTVLYGLGGNDTIDGGKGADKMYGGLGNDTYVVDNVGDVVSELAGQGTDTVKSSITYSLVDTDGAGANGGNVENLILTGTAAINGTGNALANVISANAGANVLDGAAGVDTLSYSTSTGGVIVDLGAHTASGGFAAGDTFSNFENLTGSGQIDNLTGDVNANVISGLAGNDTINGGGGNDTIIGGAGADTMDGGTGVNILSYAGSTVGVTVNLATATASGGDATGDIFSNFQSLTGSAKADVLTGDANANVINGGAGADTLDGGAGINTLSYAGSTAAVTVDLGAGTASGGDATGDIFSNFQNLTGSALADSLTGSSVANVIDGGKGADVMAGAAGNDTYLVDNVGDIVTELVAQGTDTIKSSITYSLVDTDGAGANGGNVENLVLTGTAALSGTGNALNNQITGNTGANILTGAGGADTLTGGAGADIFDFNAIADTATGLTSHDLIKDFVHLSDKIDLSTIDAISSTGTDDPFIFLTTLNAAFTGVAGQLHFITSGSNTMVEGDVNGDGTADFQIELTGTIALTAADFIL